MQCRLMGQTLLENPTFRQLGRLASLTNYSSGGEAHPNSRAHLGLN